MPSDFSPTFSSYVAGLLGTESPGYVRSALPSLLNLGYSEGMSGREMLAAYREAGGAIADTSFWNTSREVQAGIANVSAIQNLDLAAIPPEEAFAEWSTSSATGYMYRFNAVFERIDPTTGEIEQILKPVGVKSHVRLALGDVMQDVDQIVQNWDPEGDTPHDTYVGLTIGNLWRMSP